MLFLELALAAAHFVVVIDVTALTLALGVDSADTRVRAIGRHGAPAVLVVAMVAHAHRVEGQVRVRTRTDLAFLPS